MLKPGTIEHTMMKEIAKKYGVPIETVFKIVRSQADFMSYVFEHTGFDGVAFPYFGKFILKPSLLIKLNNQQFLKDELISGRKLSGNSKPGTQTDSPVPENF